MKIWKRTQQFIKTSFTDVSVSLWRRRLIATVLAVAFVVLPSVVFAQDVLQVEPVASELNLPNGDFGGVQDLRDLIIRVVRWILGFVGLIAVLVIIYGGYLWMTSAGRSERVDEAKIVIRNGVIGLTIIIASFAIVALIVNLFVDGDGGSGDGTGGSGFTGCQNCIARGGGIIEDHYPDWNQRVSRDTEIYITFTEPLFVTAAGQDDDELSFIQDAIEGQGREVNGCPVGWWCGTVNSDQLNIEYLKFEDKRRSVIGEYSGDIAVYTQDRRLFVLSPLDLLGMEVDGVPVESITEVQLFNLRTEANRQANAGSYSWNFIVTDQLDITPPRVVDIQPFDGDTAIARNKVVLISFSEPVSPMAVTGKQGGGSSFQNLEVYRMDNQTKVDGTFLVGNGYTDVWFIPSEQCKDGDGAEVLNSCNDKMYCLPENVTLKVVARAATLKSSPACGSLNSIKPFEACTPAPTGTNLYDGIVDTAKNSLDGNRGSATLTAGALPSGDGNADGPKGSIPGDNFDALGDSFAWSFSTNNNIQVSPPQIIELLPAPDAQSVSTTEPFKATFDRKMLPPTTYRLENISYPAARIFEQMSATKWERANIGYSVRSENVKRCAGDTSKQCSTNTECGTQGPCSAVCGAGALKACSLDSQCGVNNSCGRSTIRINHSGLLDPTTSGRPQVQYEPRLSSTLQDSFQNCFYLPTAISTIPNSLYGAPPVYDGRPDIDVNSMSGF